MYILSNAPPKFRIEYIFLITLDRVADVGNDVSRKFIEDEPTQVITLLRLFIDRRLVIALCRKEKVHLDVILPPVHDVNECQVLWFDAHPDFFNKFPCSCSSQRLIILHVPRRQAVFPIFIAGIETAQQQNFPIPNQQQVGRRNHPEAVHFVFFLSFSSNVSRAMSFSSETANSQQST